MFSKLMGKLGVGGQDQGTSNQQQSQQRATVVGNSLRQLQAKNHVITAMVKVVALHQDKQPKFSTGIMEVDVDNRRFAIDALLPKEGNSLLKTGVTLILTLTHQGTRHKIESQWQSSEPEGDSLKHWFELPQKIEQIQLRDNFRVQFSHANPIKVAITHAEKKPITGSLGDLSAGGMRVRVEGQIDPKPERGEIYNSCHFVLPDGQSVTCMASLMHWEYDTQKKATFLGIRFESLDGNTLRILNRFLTDVQRKHRQ